MGMEKNRKMDRQSITEDTAITDKQGQILLTSVTEPDITKPTVPCVAVTFSETTLWHRLQHYY